MTEQQRSLSILKQVTLQRSPTVVRRLRGTLLPSAEKNPPNNRYPEKIGEGWAFRIGSHFLNCLDTKLTSFVQNKTTITAWTQGSAFFIKEGYVFYRNGEEFPHCIQVARASPAVPTSFDLEAWPTAPPDIEKRIQEAIDGGFTVKHGINPEAERKKWYELRVLTDRNPGFINLRAFKKQGDKLFHSLTWNMSQDELVALLITGDTSPFIEE